MKGMKLMKGRARVVGFDVEVLLQVSHFAILHNALWVNANLFQTGLCRDPDFRDDEFVVFDLLLMFRVCWSSHPWSLDSSNPCWNDGVVGCVVFSWLVILAGMPRSRSQG